METQEMTRIHKDLREGKIVDLSHHVREELKEFKDTREGEQMITRITLKMEGRLDPVIIANRYVDEKEVESHFYYLDQKQQLRQLLNRWLNL